MSHFYDKGLYFTCTQCSNCCRHDPGYVFLSAQDLKTLSELLELSVQETAERYCLAVGMGDTFSMISLREKPNNDCVFWEDGRCTVYAARPVQCRTYPFWSTLLKDRETWEEQKESCPGIGTGRFWSRDEIEGMLRSRSENTPMMQ